MWVIYPGAEAIATEEQIGAMGSPNTVIRELEIKCLGLARALTTGEPIENVLDGMLEELETAIAGGIGVADLLGIQLVGVEPDYEVDADNLYGSVEATFVVQYRTPENAPGSIV